MNAPRRSVPGWLLFVLLVVMPLVELFVLIRIGRTVGAGWTILLLILAAVVGAWLVKHEGARTWRAFNGALAQGRLPAREIADGALVVMGGVLMMAPGVVSDVVGVLLVLPITRPLFRPAVMVFVSRRMRLASPVDGPLGTGGLGGFGPFGPGAGAPRDARRPGHQDEGPVIRGEVVDD